MKAINKRIVYSLILCLLGVVLGAARQSMAVSGEIPKLTDDNALYQAQNIYNGEYHSTTIYYKNPGSKTWNLLSRSKNYLDVVKCSSALRALNNVGQWYGHLKEDGSCGSQSEPSLFAVGNRINYDSIRSGENL